MKRVNNLNEIIKFEKRIAKKYDFDFDENEYRTQIKKLFNERGIDENNLRGFMFEDKDVDFIDDDEFMIIEIDNVFKKVYASWMSVYVRFTMFD